MRDALRRERGFLILALLCALLAVTAVLRDCAARSGRVIDVADFKPPVSALIDINSADLKLLTSLPGVGEKTALRIIEGRPYAAIEDIMRVEGIGEKTFAALRDRIRTGDTGAD